MTQPVIESRSPRPLANPHTIMPMSSEVYHVLIGACGVMVIAIGIGHNDTSSNPGRDWLHFTLH